MNLTNLNIFLRSTAFHVVSGEHGQRCRTFKASYKDGVESYERMVFGVLVFIWVCIWMVWTEREPALLDSIWYVKPFTCFLSLFSIHSMHIDREADHKNPVNRA